MSFVYLVILLVQVIVIFSLFLFRALIPHGSLSLPFFLLLLMENTFIGVLTMDIRVCILDRTAQVFSAVD